MLWLALEVWWARQEMHAVATLQRLGASLFLTVDEATGVRLPDQVLSDALESLIQIGDIHSLSLAGTRTKDADLPVLSRLPELQTLDLRKTLVSDPGLPYIARIPRLRALDLRGTQVTWRGVGQLQRRLPQLQVRWQGSVNE